MPQNTSPCSATLESNVLISAIQCINANITKSDVLGWTWENEQAFELELEAGCKYAEYADDESGSCNEEEIESAVSKEQLRDWAIKHNIKHAALNDLLLILRQQNEHLPIDPRTLLGTPSVISVKSIAGGFYHYFGVQSSLSNLVKRCAGDKSWKDVLIRLYTRHKVICQFFW